MCLINIIINTSMRLILILIVCAVVISGLVFYFSSSFSGLERQGTLDSFGSIPSKFLQKMTKPTIGDLFEFELRGSAMDPNYADYSWCQVYKGSYRNTVPQRGEVIFFNGHTSAGQEARFVKRIIGLPREKIMIANGSVYVNGSVLSESYLASDVRTTVYPDGFLRETQEVTIPENSYFVLGDNRKYSLDSRASSFGYVKREDIVGKIISFTPKS